MPGVSIANAPGLTREVRRKRKRRKKRARKKSKRRL
jgi:hypothetical protein